MTEFVFTEPKCFVEAEKVIDTFGVDIDNKEVTNAMLVLLRKGYAINEAKWRWLADNKDEISLITLETEDIGYAIADVLRFYSKGACVHKEVFGFGGMRTKRRVRNRLKRFGIPLDLFVG